MYAHFDTCPCCPQAHVCAVSHAVERGQRLRLPHELQHPGTCMYVVQSPMIPSGPTFDFTFFSYRFAFQGNSSGGYYAARNVLSLGCRIAGPQATSELLSVQGVACTFPNTTVNVIRSPSWELLLSRIGDDLMFSLLRQHAVLQRLPNRCYMQASVSLEYIYLLAVRAHFTQQVCSVANKYEQHFAKTTHRLYSCGCSRWR